MMRFSHFTKIHDIFLQQTLMSRISAFITVSQQYCAAKKCLSLLRCHVTGIAAEIFDDPLKSIYLLHLTPSLINFIIQLNIFKPSCVASLYNMLTQLQRYLLMSNVIILAIKFSLLKKFDALLYMFLKSHHATV